MRSLRDQCAREQQTRNSERKPVPETSSPHSDEVEQVHAELIPTRALVGDGEMKFLPHPIEERDHPVIEDVEGAPERSVLVARAIHHQFSVLMRKNSQRADGAHK